MQRGKCCVSSSSIRSPAVRLDANDIGRELQREESSRGAATPPTWKGTGRRTGGIDHPCTRELLSMYKFRNQVQEQIQIIATAIGKPAAKALTIVKVNAKSGFTGRKLCTDIRFLHYARINRKVAPERMRCRFPPEG